VVEVLDTIISLCHGVLNSLGSDPLCDDELIAEDVEVLALVVDDIVVGRRPNVECEVLIGREKRMYDSRD